MNQKSSNSSMRLPNPRTETQLDSVIKIAIMAVGGQGGGVLTQWIETLARSEGYAVQATSVAGVAQRTGATIYYIEMYNTPANSHQSNGDSDNKHPVFSLAPAEGDVDILIAAELMEAGRAVMRGFVTPYNTTMIASTHRAHAVSEKMVPGFGISDPRPVIEAVQEHSLRAILLDMEAIAVSEGSVISASLFGALAASGALPFGTPAFENAISSSNRGVEKSLRAFHRAMQAASASEQSTNITVSQRNGTTAASPAESGSADQLAGVSTGAMKGVPSAADISGPVHEKNAWLGLQKRILELPIVVQEMASAGLIKVVDFQDTAYGDEYLSRVENILSQDTDANQFDLTREAAKHIANAMAYDDVIRVADLKTRDSRFVHIRQEMQVSPDQRMKLTEYMHPRGEELLSLLPAPLATRIARNRVLAGFVDRILGGGRRMRSDRISGFLPLYLVAGLRRWRKHSLRHRVEVEHLENWLEAACTHLPKNYDLAVEIIKCRRLIKGYSDTHVRGQSKFERIFEVLPTLALRDDAANAINQLREAALRDEQGAELNSLIEELLPEPQLQ